MNVFVLVGVALFLYLYNKPSVATSDAQYTPPPGSAASGKSPDNSAPKPLPGIIQLPVAKPKSAGAVFGLLT